ncbi:SYBL1 like protein [Arabidopsis thaliana]|nr:hypothetical protein - Arabidopsis thaliana [Arabidopsis thaliana]CAB10356.1 SYBL1 like protein [Arabidopsis thaliana]CAB78620.1 SYBL1 like protein [Arabidopsis thaliana]
MGQESFIYSFVARGTMILAEYTEFTGNFPSIAAQCLQKLPSSSNSKFTYNCDHHTFNFLVEDAYGWSLSLSSSLETNNLYLLWFGDETTHMCFKIICYAYCVVAKDSLSKQISIAFLERVKADFKKRYGGGKASTAIAKSLNKEFGYLENISIFEENVL